MKFITFTKELLESEHSQVIRALGREIGVKSPTSKDKDVIIEEILAIQNGSLQPVEQSKKGAPVKIEVNLSRFYAKEYLDGAYQKPTVSTVLEFSDSEVGQFVADGVLQINANDGTGVFHINNYDLGEIDAFVPAEVINKFALRQGDVLNAACKPVYKNQPPVVQTVFSINEIACDKAFDRPIFENLSVCNPSEKFDLTKTNDPSLRVVDLFAPIGKGQRGLIVAPSKTGATTLLIKIANALAYNSNAKVYGLLVDYRPEEIGDIRQGLLGEVMASSFEQSYQNHIQVADYCINRAKRAVENGQDAVVIIDSITSLAKAYANVYPSVEQVISSTALQELKKVFGAGRNICGGGSLTLLATAVESDNPLEQAILQELTNICNCQITLTNNLAIKGVYPAIDLNKTHTRKTELLLTAEKLCNTASLRAKLIDLPDATARLLQVISTTDNNEQLLSNKEV